MDTYEEAVLFSYSLLESRLDRLEYIVGLPKTPTNDHRPAPTALDRIHRIERALQDVQSRTQMVEKAQELIKLYKAHGARVPTPNDRDHDSNANSPLTPAQKLAIVVDRAPAFASTASQLKALEDQQSLPATADYAKLVKLHPRIAEAEACHLQQALAISMLRRRSGLLVQRVKQVQHLGAGRCWAEWARRLKSAERTVARAEYRRREEED